MYLSGMIWLGDRLVEQSWFPWPHNGGFTISTFLFLLLLPAPSGTPESR